MQSCTNEKEELEILKPVFLQKVKKQDPCYRCAYGRGAPCIGFCYKQMTAHPKDYNEM